LRFIPSYRTNRGINPSIEYNENYIIKEAAGIITNPILPYQIEKQNNSGLIRPRFTSGRWNKKGWDWKRGMLG